MTSVIYGLHALNLASGLLAVIGLVFFIGWPSFVAVILNYVKQGAARGTWLESHFRWQIRTFWVGFLSVAALLTAFGMLSFAAPVDLTLLLTLVPLFLVGAWFVYRIARGWRRLRDRSPMPA